MAGRGAGDARLPTVVSSALAKPLRRWWKRRSGVPVRTAMGRIDACSPAFLTGWCVDAQRAPSPVDVFVNGTHLLRAAPNHRRDDLTALGLPAECGFVVLYPEPLTLTDVLEVRSPDGQPLDGSPNTHHRERLSRLLNGIDPATMNGLELGPLDRPTLSKARGRLAYIDHAPTEVLRAKYQGSPAAMVDLDRIQTVDYAWPSGSLRARIPDGKTFDYAVAVHVMEHVADPIGWLGHLAEVIRPGGTISLALPERSLCFDHRREPTRPADLIDAWIARLDRPSPRQVFDHVAFISPLHLGTDLPALPDRARLADALDAARRTAAGEYIDAHCNVFTAASFRQCWAVIDSLGLLPLELAALHDPYPGGDEFIVNLRRT